MLHKVKTKGPTHTKNNSVSDREQKGYNERQEGGHRKKSLKRAGAQARSVGGATYGAGWPTATPPLGGSTGMPLASATPKRPWYSSALEMA